MLNTKNLLSPRTGLDSGQDTKSITDVWEPHPIQYSRVFSSSSPYTLSQVTLHEMNQYLKSEHTIDMAHTQKAPEPVSRALLYSNLDTPKHLPWNHLWAQGFSRKILVKILQLRRTKSMSEFNPTSKWLDNSIYYILELNARTLKLIWKNSQGFSSP